MALKPGYWTRKLELDLVEFVRQKDYLWRPLPNTNHQIKLKYQAYAEFAARLGRAFTARSVRDRWVNIRSTFSHNLRKVNKSSLTAKKTADIYVPCWPLWKPLLFLRDGIKKDDSNCESYQSDTHDSDLKELPIKNEVQSETEDLQLNIRQQGWRTDRPRRKSKLAHKPYQRTKCKKIIENLLEAMKPLISDQSQNQYRFFGKHIAERLNHMRPIDADSASNDIMKLLDEWQPKSNTTIC